MNKFIFVLLFIYLFMFSPNRNKKLKNNVIDLSYIKYAITNKTMGSQSSKSQGSSRGNIHQSSQTFQSQSRVTSSVNNTRQQPQTGNQVSKNYKYFKDRFTSYSDLEKALRNAGLESSNLIVGIDFTRSNEWTGGLPFFPDNHLHSIKYQPNLYQQVISIMGNSLEPFDDDKFIPTYGFGDTTTTDKQVFSFAKDLQTGFDMPCYTFANVLQAYNTVAVDIASGKFQLSGPTTFTPLIKKAIEIVKANRSYHILLIICDGGVTNKQETIEAIVEASQYPLSIICVGVGKGPWDIMQEFDDEIPERSFDNFQFVNFYETMKECENIEAEFAKRCLMEIPDQYEYIRKHLL